MQIKKEITAERNIDQIRGIIAAKLLIEGYVLKLANFYIPASEYRARQSASTFYGATCKVSEIDKTPKFQNDVKLIEDITVTISEKELIQLVEQDLRNNGHTLVNSAYSDFKEDFDSDGPHSYSSKSFSGIKCLVVKEIKNINVGELKG